MFKVRVRLRDMKSNLFTKEKVIDLRESHELKKRQLLRNNEYYDMQNVFDELYENSKRNFTFKDLMNIISSRQNILLAFRNIKKNKGSTTVGTDDIDIQNFKDMNIEKYVQHIQNLMADYHPKSVRRVEIPKPNGKTRPLGIPCMEDRIVQQCIKQVLEPICEAKFHKHSYGFRPNRSTEHAIARAMYLINQSKLHYVVDVDIKGFFDNVNHSKLKKQMWNLGIQDKNLICVIGKILKSEIQGIGIPTKGTPQGGIISPLLSNIVLNELDWWVSSQWETFKTNKDYNNDSNRYRALRTSNLKKMYIVRYADDFKIFCEDYKTAQKIFEATKKWLVERLGLEVSTDKSKITNLRKKYTEFLGFKLRVIKKADKHVCYSRMSDKAIKNTIEDFKKQIKRIQKNLKATEVTRLNAKILGSHQYYKLATHVVKDFKKINFLVTRNIDVRLKKKITHKPKYTSTYYKLYSEYKGKIRTICDITIFPIYGCIHHSPLCFNQNICNYTENGRNLIHDKAKGYNHLVKYLLQANNDNLSTELCDNRISLIIGQQGKCYVTKKPLEIGNMECHHKCPKSKGGTDSYQNLTWIESNVHKLIHATQIETIQRYMEKLSLSYNELKRVNSLRRQVGNSDI